MRRTALMREVEGLPLEDDRKFSNVFNMHHTRFVLSYPAQILVLSQHKRVSFMYDKIVASRRTQIYV